MDQSTPSTESPSLQDEHERLLAEAYSADIADETASSPSSAQQDGEATEPTDEAPAQAKTEQDKPTPDNPEPSADGRLRGPDGKFLPKDPGAQAPTEPAHQSPVQEPVQLTKEQKEEARLAKSWQALEREKAEARQLKDELLRLKQDFGNQRQQNDGAKFDSKEYNRAANHFEDEADQLMRDGDIEGALKKRQTAKEVRSEGQRVFQTEQQQHQESFNMEWQRRAAELKTEAPDLFNPSTELGQEMHQMMNENPELGLTLDGFRKAYTVLQWKRAAAENSGLREREIQKDKEIERLTKLTTPAGGKDPAKHSKAKSTMDLPLNEMHARLEHEAELADYV